MNTLVRDIVPESWPQLLASRGEPPYRGRQLAHWLFARGALDWDAMHNLPRSLRAGLAADFDPAGLSIEERLVAADGTRKFLFRLRDGHTIESVIIPMEHHATFCISSQVGCAMACRFCATARGGLARGLSPGEIVEQVQRLAADLTSAPFPQHGDRGYNVVFMGMGEPLDNFDAVRTGLAIMTSPLGLGLSTRRVQLSTSAPPQGLANLDSLDLPVGLTISIGGADDAARRKVMPVSGRAGVADALAAAERFARRSGRRVTIAWVLIAERTDQLEQARTLARLVANRPFKVNLIPLNELDDDDLAAAASERILAFQRVLVDAGVPAYIRVSGGRDIGAACGQLRRRRASSR
ncbi:MAG TPA: 23S rRNA (adenine(2503)-C(2))-methyltransferase RlmN [Candidatus Krumholzibacteria bacterium]|nr:23S rRNA (adenine(2503)-C(2))-methyltransferase RlmN [Candidatus Krumholzibacteria bacterium]HPD71219.1 23S rRNA (adenine(2503)-C(2))-methyltransferase RlmN [Candidatus Krumholzibacteria bacterium]HRY39081.1 23S rRNA (adenine(2503)-C(2))-methyltransferase RlmN [Candidatus Krumholzibacteria bacterium]